MSVERGTAAARQNIEPGDIITSINQEPVKTPKEFREAVKKADLKAGIVVDLISGKTARFEILNQSEP
jgi:S1-C subfamily serine protease